MNENPLWDLIQKYMDSPKHRYPPRPADLARETGISEQVLSKWKAKATLPAAAQLLSFSVGTGVPYEDLLRAALEGKRYLPPGADVSIPRRFQGWLEGPTSPLRQVSEPVDIPEVALAADDQEQSIAGEHLEPDTP